LLRKQIFDLLKALSNEQWPAALSVIEGGDPDDQEWTAARLETMVFDYYETHDLIRLDPEARNRKHTYIDDQDPRRWLVDQVLVDSDEQNDWVIKLSVDLPASNEARRPVLTLHHIGSVAD